MDWQSIITYVVIAAAILWVVRRVWRVVRSARATSGPVAGCSSCPQFTKEPPRGKATPLVQLKGKGPTNGST